MSVAILVSTSSDRQTRNHQLSDEWISSVSLMRRLPPLPALRAFEAAARHASFKQAANELAVTPTAISHQIRSLEEQVGLRLFERRTRQVVLTEAGRLLYPVLRDGFDAFAAMLERLNQAKNRATVTISATTAFTARWLVPRVSGFQALHPDIDLRLHASDATVDLKSNAADIAIRYGRGPYPGLRGKVMFADHFAPVVHPGLDVATPNDLGRSALIHFEWRREYPANPTWARWFQAAGLDGNVPSAQLRFSDESHAIQAAVAGQGVALLSLLLVRDELLAGHLVQPFGPIVEGMTYHLLTADRSTSHAVAAALAWLRKEAEAVHDGGRIIKDRI
jgi:LysR family transcriptional regulator, glycine cleavage system transcriptional activator